MKLLFALLLKCPIKALQLKCRDIHMRLRHPTESHSDLFQKFILNGRTLFCIATDILTNLEHKNKQLLQQLQDNFDQNRSIRSQDIRTISNQSNNITKIFTYVFAIDRYIEVFLCFCLFLLHRGSFQLKVF